MAKTILHSFFGDTVYSVYTAMVMAQTLPEFTGFRTAPGAADIWTLKVVFSPMSPVWRRDEMKTGTDRSYYAKSATSSSPTLSGACFLRSKDQMFTVRQRRVA